MGLLLIFSFASISAASSLDEENQRAADDAIDALERQGYAGSVLVAQSGIIRYHRDSGVDVSSSCVPSYWIASITKQFVAVGILILHEREKLNIHDSIAIHLPTVPAEKSEITIFHLLTHTSGLQQEYAADGIADRDSALNSLLASDLRTKPGDQFSYANDNYNLLAIILEIRSGMSYEEFLRAEILLPAGMKNSGSWGMQLERGTCVPPVATQLEQGALSPNWGFRGATGMRASVLDLYSFMQLLQNPAFLSKESVDMLMGNHLQLSSGTEIGFNWFGQYSDQGIYTKSTRGQESFGGNAVVYHYPKQRLTIITATNAGPAETGDGPIKGWSRKTHEALAGIYVVK